MGDIVREIAEGALKVLGEKAPGGNRIPGKAPDLANANSEAVDALFAGKKVAVRVKDLNCPMINELRRDVDRFAGSVQGLVFEVECGSGTGPAPKSTATQTASAVSPEKQVLEEILADVISREGGACVVEPGKACVGCGGRCKTLGF